MKGYFVPRKAGWDTHGLPVELEVERRLGLDGKEQIEAYGVDKFIEECKKSVWKYKHEWEEMSERVGFWADMDNPYITYENSYIESVWWSLKQIWEKLDVQGTQSGALLSSLRNVACHEVAQGYRNISERSVYVRFRTRIPTRILRHGRRRRGRYRQTSRFVSMKKSITCSVNSTMNRTVPRETRATGLRKNSVPKFSEKRCVYWRSARERTLGIQYQPIYPYAEATVAEQGKKAYIIAGHADGRHGHRSYRAGLRRGRRVLDAPMICRTQFVAKTAP